MSVREGVNAPSVMPSGRPMSYLSVDTNPDMFGAGVGRAISGLGGSVMDLSATLEANGEKLRKEAAALTANQAFVTSALAAGEAEAEFLSTTGINTMNAYGPYVERMKQIRQEALDSLDDDDAKRIFDETSQPMFLSNINGGAGYAAKQKLVAASDAAKSRIEIVMNDSRTKFGDDALFQANLGAIDSTIAQLGAVQGWDEVTILSEQVKQRSLAWEYRVTSMSLSNPEGAAKLFNSVRDGLNSESRLRIEKDLTGALYNRASQGFVQNLVAGRNASPGPGFTHAVAAAGVPPNVRIGIIDRTSVRSMTPKAWGILHGMAARAAELGITLTVVAAGGPGHASHGSGTEWDIVGENAGGQRWNSQQKTYILRGGAEAGADRFGMYPSGSVHVGYSGAGGGGTSRVPAVWGAGGATSRAAGGRNFSDPNEAQFVADFDRGGLTSGLGASRGTTYGSFLQRVIGAESGGRSGLVSSAGALGIMQVTPSTGAMVAQQLGIPFDAYRLQHDPDYNMLIGTTYLNQMLEKYDGNEVLAAAAYNAGPGAVDGWLLRFGDPRSGTITSEQWAQLIPYDETRDYVAKIMSGAGGVAAGPSMPLTGRTSPADYATYVETALQWAESVKPGDPNFAAAVLTDLDTVYAREKKIQTEFDQENYDIILGSATTPREDGSLPTTEAEVVNSAEMKDRWNNLDNGQRAAIRNILKGNVEADNGPTAEQLRRYEELGGMYKTDWAAFKEVDLAADEKLYPRHREELVKLRLEGPPTSKPYTPADIALGTGLSLVAPQLAQAGISKDKDPAAYNAFAGVFADKLRIKTEIAKRQLTEDEIWDTARWLLLQTDGLVDPSGLPWVSDRPMLTYEGYAPTILGGTLEKAPSGIPESDRIAIMEAYALEFPGYLPTEAQIQQYYDAGRAAATPQVPGP